MFKIMLYIPSVMYHPLSIFTNFKVFIIIIIIIS